MQFTMNTFSSRRKGNRGIAAPNPRQIQRRGLPPEVLRLLQEPKNRPEDCCIEVNGDARHLVCLRTGTRKPLPYFPCGPLICEVAGYRIKRCAPARPNFQIKGVGIGRPSRRARFTFRAPRGSSPGIAGCGHCVEGDRDFRYDTCSPGVAGCGPSRGRIVAEWERAGACCQDCHEQGLSSNGIAGCSGCRRNGSY